MTAEFDWWLLIVGLVVGAGLAWLILAEWPRHDEELEEAEIGLEAGWIAAQLRAAGTAVDPETAEAVLRQHRAYLRLPPPDDDPPWPTPTEDGAPGSPAPSPAVPSPRGESAPDLGGAAAEPDEPGRVTRVTASEAES